MDDEEKRKMWKFAQLGAKSVRAALGQAKVDAGWPPGQITGGQFVEMLGLVITMIGRTMQSMEPDWTEKGREE